MARQYMTRVCRNSRGGEVTNHLPERKENNKFYTQQLEKGLIRCQRNLQIQIKRNETVHGDRHGDHVCHHSPHMRVLRTKRFIAVDTLDLRHCCDDGAGDSDKYVLEYANPDDVEPGQAAVRLGQFAAWPRP